MTIWPAHIEKKSFVRSLFVSVFKREPSASAETSYVNYINEGHTVGNVVARALKSEEASKSVKPVAPFSDFMLSTVVRHQLSLDDLRLQHLAEVFKSLHGVQKFSDIPKSPPTRDDVLSCNLRLEANADGEMLQGWILVPAVHLEGVTCTISRGSEVVAQKTLKRGLNPILVELPTIDDQQRYQPITCTFDGDACETTSIDTFGQIASLLNEVLIQIPVAPNPAVYDESTCLDEVKQPDSPVTSYLELGALLSKQFGPDDMIEDGNIAALLQWYLCDASQSREAPATLPLSAELIELVNSRVVDERLTAFPVPFGLLQFAKKHPDIVPKLFGSPDEFRSVVYKLFTAPGLQNASNRRLIPAALADLLKEQHPDTSTMAFPLNWFWWINQSDEAAAQKREFRISDYRETTVQVRLALAKSLESILYGRNLEFIPREWQELLFRLADPIHRRLSYLALYQDQKAIFGAKALDADDETDDAPDATGVDIDRLIRNPGVRLFSPEERWRLKEQSLSTAVRELTQQHWKFLDQRLWLVGHDGGSGLANNRRMLEHALKATFAPPSTILVDKIDLVEQFAAARNTGAALNRPVVVAALNADKFGVTIPRLPDALLRKAAKIGFFLWETSVPPPAHVAALPFADEIWTPSEYVRGIYAPFAPKGVKVVNIRKHIEIPANVQPMSRAEIGVAEDDFVFLVIADFDSSIIRKHPLPALRAFRRAFPATRKDVKLVLKIRRITPNHWSNQGGYWNLVQRELNQDPRIKLVVGNLPSASYWGLLKASNCFVTLHRSEGFGYGAAHSLGLGVPVISADYSGVTDFCTKNTSFLVETKEIAVVPHQVRSDSPVGNWGEPSIDDAARQMQRVVEDAAEAKKRTSAGQRLIATEYSLEKFSGAIRERLSTLGVRKEA